MSESFGRRLRRERERRHITVASIAEATKISVSLLKGLERDDVAHWPPGIFRRSFVRSYAEAIGLDPDAVVREFTARFPDPHTGPSSAARPARLSDSNAAPMRLTLANGPMWLDRHRMQTQIRRSWKGALLDAAAVLAAAAVIGPTSDLFWMSLALLALGYYTASALLLGTSPGVALLEPRSKRRPNAGLRLLVRNDRLTGGERQPLEPLVAAPRAGEENVRPTTRRAAG